MGQVMVRIGEHTHQALRELAQADRQSMREVLEKAVEEYRRRRILEEANAAYAALRNEPEAWREMRAEQTEWEALSDGLPEGEAWTEEGRAARSDGKRVG